MTKRSLAAVRPDLLPEWSPKNSKRPDEVSPGSHFVATWVCPVGHGEYECRVAERTRTTRRPAGCPQCGLLQREATKQAKRLLQGSLASDNPELVDEWSEANDKSPQEVTSGSKYSALWKCLTDDAHPEYRAIVKSRARNGTGCPLCARDKKQQSLRKHWTSVSGSLAQTHPDLVSEWHPENTLTPQEIAPGSKYSAVWVCAKGHEFTCQVHNRTRKGSGPKGPTGCPECAAKNFVSRGEIEASEILTALGIQHYGSARSVIPNAELDIYVPDKKFAIEFNGLYWHSERKREPNYHAVKQSACQEAGITLYQIWEDDWATRRDIVVRGLAHRLGVLPQARDLYPSLPAYWFERVDARKTRVSTLSRREACEFLQAHHIQGAASGSIYLGLRDDQDRLRAVIVCKRTGKLGEYSIERYATAGIVRGGFSKLLAHAEKKTTGITRWVTFADLSLSNGDLYANNGFIVDKTLPPDYTYLVNNQRKHKFGYRLQRFRSDPDLIWQEGLSERELATLNGLYRIWDSGKIRWVKDVVKT